MKLWFRFWFCNQQDSFTNMIADRTPAVKFQAELVNFQDQRENRVLCKTFSSSSS